jgi:hypothetical protein
MELPENRKAYIPSAGLGIVENHVTLRACGFSCLEEGAGNV